MSINFTDVWVIGDSLIHWGAERAELKGLTHFQLEKENIRVRWFGVRGMAWPAFKNRIQYLMMMMARPFMIVVHLGGNSVVDIKLRTFQKKIERDFKYMFITYPGVIFIWSDILPRLEWRGAEPKDFPAMERKRCSLNRTARRAVASYAYGRQIIHNNIDHTPGLFRHDGTHLSDIGSDILLVNMQEALRSFIMTDNVVYMASD